MGEGLSASDVGKDLAEHSQHTQSSSDESRHDRVVSIVEALLLAVVAVLAAWSGYSSAKWSTESRLDLAQASTARNEASRANIDAGVTKDFDASAFDAWFSAYVAGNERAMGLAEQRFRPEFDVAFRAWRATDPDNNPDAPPGPTNMAEYDEPGLDEARRLDEKADDLYAEGSEAGGYADSYVRTTVFLATVLFLVGISGHFRFRIARIGLVGVGSAILAYAVVLLIDAPKPPG